MLLFWKCNQILHIYLWWEYLFFRRKASVIMSTGGSIRRVWRDAGLILYIQICFSGSTCRCLSHYYIVFYYQDTLRQQICILKYFENTPSDQYQIIYSYVLLVDKSLGCSRCCSDALKCFRCFRICLSSCTFSFKCALMSFSRIYLYSLRTLLYPGVLWLVVYDVY